MKTSMRQLIRNPERVFSDPVELVQCKSLTRGEKVLVLKSWQADLMELQKANEESMLREGAGEGFASERLASVRAAIAGLEAQSESNH